VKTALSRVKSAAVPAFIEITALDRVQPAGAGPDRSEREPAQRNLDDIDDNLRAINRQGKVSTFGGSAAALTVGIVPAGAKLGPPVVGAKVASVVETKAAGAAAVERGAKVGVGGTGVLCGLLRCIKDCLGVLLMHRRNKTQS